jgi:hypothetical protein
LRKDEWYNECVCSKCKERVGRREERYRIKLEGGCGWDGVMEK